MKNKDTDKIITQIEKIAISRYIATIFSQTAKECRRKYRKVSADTKWRPRLKKLYTAA